MDINHTIKKPFVRSAATLAVSSIALSAGAAWAQDEDGGGSGLITGVDTITVEATRRTQDVQTVPIPMTAVTGDALDRKFAQDLRDLTNAAPNIQLEPIGIFQNSASFYIRGQGTSDIESASDPKVSIFVDGVVQARVSSSLSDMLDIEAVEILRGPQGTLFGRNTVAGAVLVRHKAPDLEAFGVEGSVQVGNFGRLDVKGIVNAPIITDKVAARVAFKSTNHDGYWRNPIFNNERRGKTDRITLLPSVKFVPNDNLDITIRGEYSRSRDDTNMTQAHHYCRDNPVNALLGIPVQNPPGNDLVILTQSLYNLIVLGQDPFTAAANAEDLLCAKPIESQTVAAEYTAINTEDRGNFNNIDAWGITAEINYNIPDIGTLTYIGGYRQVDEDIIFTIDVAAHDLFAGRRIQDHDQMSHELRFASEFSDRVDFVAGVYYFEQEYTMKQESWGILFAPNIILGPFDGPTFTSPNTQGQAGFSNQKNDAWAIFADANIHITDKLTFIVGGRYTEESKDFMHCAVGAGNPDVPISVGAAGCTNVPVWTPNPLAPPLPGAGPTPTPLLQLMPGTAATFGGFVPPNCTTDSTGQVFCNNVNGDGISWSQFTPRAGVTYQINDDIMTFFTWSRGWRSGGFNGRGGSATTIGPFDPEKADNFELGIKSSWMDNRLQVNLNGFYTDTKGFQTAFIRAAPDGGGGQETIVDNLGSVITKGIELEINAVPVDGLTLFGSLGYLNYKEKDFCTDGDGPFGTDPNNPPPTPGPVNTTGEPCGELSQIFGPTGDFGGWLQPTDNSNLQPSTRAPKWTISAGFAYEHIVGNAGSITFAADWLYAAKTTVAASNALEANGPDGPGVYQYDGTFISHMRQSSHIINMSVVWKDLDDRYRVSFFVKNLTNELFNQATTNVGGLLNFRVPNIRRHWGLELSFSL